MKTPNEALGQGGLSEDPAVLDAHADDFGHIVHHRPRAVLRPRHPDEVVEAVRWARAHKLTLAPRGQGHSTHGQAQAEGGLVVDLSALSRVVEISGDTAWVEAGAQWREVMNAAFAQRLTPPTLTDLLDLRVGGTLAVGGIGGQSFRHGAQTDCVRELEVVTGAGERLWCSPTREPALFDACRAGLGQCGIVLQARLALVPAPAVVRTYTFAYRDLAAFLADLHRLASEDRFDHLTGLIVSWDDGGFRPLLLAATYHPPEAPSDERALLSGLERGEPVDREDRPYPAFADRIAVEMARMREAGLDRLPHPFVDTFLPASTAAPFIARTLADLDPREYVGSLLLYPLRRSRCHTPLLQLPDEEELLLFDVLPVVRADQVEKALAFNRALYDRGVAAGGKGYPIGSVPLGAADWHAHYGEGWARFAAAKARFDPDRLLAPGQGIFP